MIRWEVLARNCIIIVVELMCGVMPRDAAFEAMTAHTQEAYENETYRNNAEATMYETRPSGYFRYSIQMNKPIMKGQEILCTYGWDFHERTSLAQRTKHVHACAMEVAN